MSSREEFKAWYRKNVCSWSNLSIDSDGEYFGQMARTAWKSWQASRQALVVEMPDRSAAKYRGEDPEIEGGYFEERLYIADFKVAIEAAGVRVKP